MGYELLAEPERSAALAYLNSMFDDFIVGKHLVGGIFEREVGSIGIVCFPERPNHLDFRYGWRGSGSIAREWLVGEIIAYLKRDIGNVVVIEDPNSTPRDTALMVGAVGPAWFHKDRVLWPIMPTMATPDQVDKALSWGLSGHLQIITFCRIPPQLRGVSENVELLDTTLSEIALSTTRFVVSVFDGEGYLVWNREVVT